MIGPHEAAELLELNRGNRPLNPTKVHHLARQMREGRWKDTGIPIILYRQGHEKLLDDGQHRLYAIIECGMTLPFTISVTDVRVFDVVDTGKPRTLGDLIAINDGTSEGVTGKRAAAVGMAVDLWMRGRMSTAEYSQHTISERMELLEEYPNDAVFLQGLIRQHKRAFQHHRLPHAGWLAGALEIKRADEEVGRFFDGVYMLEAGEIIRSLSAALAIRDKAASPPEIIHGQFPVICRSWNNWLVGAWLRREETAVGGLGNPTHWLSAQSGRREAEPRPGQVGSEVVIEEA
jgi:hypothetical protein